VTFRFTGSTDSDNDAVSYNIYICTDSGFVGSGLCSGTSVTAGGNFVPPFNQNFHDNLIPWPSPLYAATSSQQISQDLSMIPKWFILLGVLGLLSVIISLSVKNITHRRIVYVLFLIIIGTAVSCSKSSDDTVDDSTSGDSTSGDSTSDNSTSDNTTTSSDTTAPTASVTTATITTSENAVVQSTETGTAYLVNTAVTVSNLASITGAADNQSNSVTISSAATNTNLPATGLADGTYKVYAVDSAGLLSSASTNSVTLLIDYALDFDGTDDNVSANGVATELASSTNLPLSVSAWVYPENGTKEQLVFGFYKNNAFANGPSVWFGGSNYKFAYWNQTLTTVHSSSTYAINNWHHVVLTIRDNRSGVLYVNGSSALTISAANGEGGLDMFSIGVDYDSSSGSAGNPAQYFDGKIDEVAVWNDELTSAEVTAIYNSGNMLNVSSNSGNYASAINLKGYYRFNEGSGTSLQDNSSNSNTGTITGATWTAGFVSE